MPKTHGYASETKDSGAYSAWRSMRMRCLSQTDTGYRYYGARGITICERWNNFLNFLWDMGERPEGMTLDRINNNGNYEPSNCRWATQIEQVKNRRNNVFITFNNETLCVADWARKTGINKNTLQKRLYAGWPPEKALTAPIRIQ